MEQTNKEKIANIYLMMSGTLLAAGLCVLGAYSLKLNYPAIILSAIVGLSAGGYYTAKALEIKKNTK